MARSSFWKNLFSNSYLVCLVALIGVMVTITLILALWIPMAHLASRLL